MKIGLKEARPNPNADNLVFEKVVAKSGGLRSKRILPPPLPEYCSVNFFIFTNILKKRKKLIHY